MTRFVSGLLAWGLLLAQLCGLTTAVSAQSGPTPSEAPRSDADTTALRERAAAFWAARVAGDAEGQWQLLEPRGKGRTTPQDYAADPVGGRFVAYQIEDATISGLFATVKVRLLVQQILPVTGGPSRALPPQATVVEDGWIRIRGVWYRKMDEGANSAQETRQP